MSTQSLNRALKVFRIFNRISQSTLATNIGVSKSFISEVESGKRSVTLKLVEKYSEEFSIAPSEILSLAEAYDNREYRSGPSDLILKIIDWLSIDSEDPDELALPMDKKLSREAEVRI